ncbi:hypothetical protein MKW98_004951 [Papaver atlanticum]|uniref:Uncharacterized protein n=1 Tax=Papaver atlanticum TaxID=357466 RepID=A0AAD4XEC7_9MAGN|nr:hypothetical protein MKW98_004951 [Papaver atlanticum]
MSSEKEEKMIQRNHEDILVRGKNQESMHTLLIQIVKVGTSGIGKIIEMAPIEMALMGNLERMGRYGELGEVIAATEENQAICRHLLSGLHTCSMMESRAVVRRSLFQ